MLCLAVEFLSYGPLQLVLRACVLSSFLTFESTIYYHDKVFTKSIKQASVVQWLFLVPCKPRIAGLILVFLSLSDETIN